MWAARSLARAPADLVLIDQHNYHSFLPLLYQVAAAELEPEAIAFPLRSITRHWPNTRFVQARVTGLDERLVSDGDSERDLHGTDMTFHRPHRPDVVVYPLSTAHVSAVLAIADERRVPVTPFGAGSSKTRDAFPRQERPSA